MTAVLDRPLSTAAEAAREATMPQGGGTLEELLGSALREARTNGSTECPVCHASITCTRAGAREAAQVAECGGCGSRLS